MPDTPALFGASSPFFLAAYVVVALAALGVFWRLNTQWRLHEVDTPSRLREFLALAIATGVALLLLAYADGYFRDRAERQRLQVELRDRDRQARELRARISTEVDAVRAMLADRTVRNIERDALEDARKELARFAALQDPRITQMLALIDKELEIRSLVRQSLSETEPDKLHLLYTRLSALAPDMPDYRSRAQQFGAKAQNQNQPAAAKPAVGN